MRRRYKPRKKVVFYHVMTRTAQQKFWLENEQELKAYWVDLLKFYSSIFYVEILSYTILSDHFHICLSVRRPQFDPEDVRRRFEACQARNRYKRPFEPNMVRQYYNAFCDLSKFMHAVNWRMAIRHNRMKKTKGHFWGAPFKSKVIDSKQYLLTVMTYIELNPVRAGMVNRAEDFPFSSIARIKEALVRRTSDPTPKVGFLATLPDFRRGEAYIQLVDTLYAATEGGRSRRSATNRFLTDYLTEEELQAMAMNLTHRTPTDWSRKTMSESHERRIRQMAPS